MKTKIILTKAAFVLVPCWFFGVFFFFRKRAPGSQLASNYRSTWPKAEVEGIKAPADNQASLHHPRRCA